MSSFSNTGQDQNLFSLQLRPRNLFLPATLALVFLLKWKLDLQWWGLALILSALPIYYFALPRVVARKQREFEREVLRLLQQGRKSELLEAYRRQRLLRLLAPGGQVQKQLGFIYSEIGDFDRARACYARAARQASAGDRLGILSGLAQARYRSGEFEGAEAVYRELLRRGQQLPEVMSGLAHCLVLQERDLGEALRHAKSAVQSVSGGPLEAATRMTLAEVLLARGKPGKARRELADVKVPEGDRWLEARYSWISALLAVSDGDVAEAAELFEEVTSLDEKGGLGDLARDRLAELGDEADDEEEIRIAG